MSKFVDGQKDRGPVMTHEAAQPAEPKQASREWLIAEISRHRRAIAWYARENGDKRAVDEIVHAIEVCYPDAAPPAQTVPREPDTPEYRGLGCCLGPK